MSLGEKDAFTHAPRGASWKAPLGMRAEERIARTSQVSVDLGVWLEKPTCDGEEGVLEKKGQDSGSTGVEGKRMSCWEPLRMMSWGS